MRFRRVGFARRDGNRFSGTNRVPEALCAAVALSAVACGAVYPELSTPVRSVPENVSLKPPPPKALRYVVFHSAEIPNRTRDGRKWDRYGGGAPDPFAKLLVNGKELILTPVQSDTLAPTWPDQTRANYFLPSDAKLEVQLWDSNALTHHPICLKVINAFEREISQDTLSVVCDSGARVVLTIAPARARMGLGLYYELRTSDIGVTRVIRESPAARFGIKKGDQILRIQGRDASKLDAAEAKSLVNANARTGLKLTVKHADGRVQNLTLREGPMYPAVDEGLPVDG
jgi:hypothetical protein